QLIRYWNDESTKKKVMTLCRYSSEKLFDPVMETVDTCRFGKHENAMIPHHLHIIGKGESKGSWTFALLLNPHTADALPISIAHPLFGLRCGREHQQMIKTGG